MFFCSRRRSRDRRRNSRDKRDSSRDRRRDSRDKPDSSRNRRDRSRDRRRSPSNERRTYRKISRSRSRSNDKPYKNNATNGRSEHNRQNEDKEIERWPNDKYAENERRTNPFARKHFKLDDDQKTEIRMQKYDKQTRRQFEHDIMDTRRTKREIIGREGTSIVWGKSPPPSEV